jgi:GNAT superfamily N-acetyltransferase
VPISIYQASYGDAETLHGMLKNKAVLEGLSSEFSATPQSLATMLERGNSMTLIASYDKQPAGMANYHFEDSTFSATPLIMLDDLYTAPDFGGKGIAKALLHTIAQTAIEQGYKLKIGPLISNTRPLEWYQRLGARPVYDARILRIDDVQAFLNAL